MRSPVTRDWVVRELLRAWLEVRPDVTALRVTFPDGQARSVRYGTAPYRWLDVTVSPDLEDALAGTTATGAQAVLRLVVAGRPLLAAGSSAVAAPSQRRGMDLT